MSSCPGWWMLHGAGTSLSQVEHAAKLGKGLKALDRLEQTLGLGLVRRTRTPGFLFPGTHLPQGIGYHPQG